MSGKFIAKRFLLAVTALVMMSWLPSSAHAVFDSGSTGADGEFAPTASATIQVPEPDGVFNFTTVNIPSGVTIKFKKNSHNTPVTILASGDVTIAGSINVSGGGPSGVNPGTCGPGGFDGGWGGRQGWLSDRGMRGEGPGGGSGGVYSWKAYYSDATGTGAGGSFHTAGGDGGAGATHGPTYGNGNLVCLIGGSGGGGSCFFYNTNGCGGGGGGGAILIASSGTITVSGSIYANGGNGAIYQTNSLNSGSDYWYAFPPGSGGGSGGAIRLVADTITGDGTIRAVGGSGGNATVNNARDGATGGKGYIRMEANVFSWSANTDPGYGGIQAASAVYPSPMPSLRIVSVGGVPVPDITTGDFTNPDIQIPYGTQNPVDVVVSANNIPLSTLVTVMVGSAKEFTANPVNCSALSSPDGTDASSTAVAQVNLPTNQPTGLSVYASYTMTAQAGDPPLYADGELVKEVRVSSALGSGKSEVTYITESGKEVLARLYK